MLYQIPVRCRFHNTRAVMILKIRSAAEMIAMSVSEDEGFDLRGI